MFGAGRRGEKSEREIGRKRTHHTPYSSDSNRRVSMMATMTANDIYDERRLLMRNNKDFHLKSTYFYT